MAEKIEFKRGDSKIMRVTIPRSIYEANSRLYFSAKPAVDNDKTDMNAKIESSATFEGLNETGAIFRFDFSPEDTERVEFNSEGETVELDGELEYTTLSGKVLSFPNNNKFLKVLVYPDIRRKGLNG